MVWVFTTLGMRPEDFLRAVNGRKLVVFIEFIPQDLVSTVSWMTIWCKVSWGEC